MTENTTDGNNRLARGGAVGSAMLLLALAAGCSTPQAFRQISYDDWAQKRYRSALNAGQPSEDAQRYLRRHELTQAFEEDPYQVLADMDRGLCPKPSREQLYVLSELSYLAGSQAEPDGDDARMFYLSAARYAYAFLFADDAGPSPNAFDPRFRIAIDLYNHSLAGAFEHRRTDWKSRLDGTATAPLVRGSMRLSVADASHIELDDIDRGTAAHRLEITALDNHFRRSGIGLPVMAVREGIEKRVTEEGDTPLIKLSKVFAATALIRFPDSICGTGVETEGVSAVLESYDPVRDPFVTLGSRTVPLEADLTVPLAFLLAQEKTIVGKGVAGLYRKLQGEVIAEQRGLILLQPYEPGKIPVVFVHGLLSSPFTWVQMINDLMADPELTPHFRFAFFFYPTGNPILYSAHELREILQVARREMDPEGTDEAMDRMVLVGHSMGGLLSRLMITGSQGDFLKGSTGSSIEELGLDPEQVEVIRKVDYFEPLPFVRRVLFLATPHRGADMASGIIGRVGDTVIAFPRYMISEIRSAVRSIGMNEEEVESGIDNLRYGSNFINTLNSLPISDQVPYHLVIGNQKAANTPGGTDGVVKYDSSRIDGALSEKIVKSGHNVQMRPPTVLEVRRILLEHLESQIYLR